MYEDIPRGVRGRTGGLQAQSMPLAAWASEDRLRESRRVTFDGASIFLGVVGATFDRRPGRDGQAEIHALGGKLIGIADDRHVGLVAGSRSGKGRCVIVPTLLHYEGSTLAIDPKGDLATITARCRETVLGQRVVVLDPFSVTRGFAAGRRGRFNPMSILRPNSPTLKEDADLIADAMVIAEGSEPHWDESARNFIAGVVCHVATWPKYENARDLVTVYDLCVGRADDGKTKGMEVLKAEMHSNEAASGAVQDAAADFFDKSDGERDSVLSTLRRHIRFLSYDAIRDQVSGHDVDLADLKRQKVSLYLCLPATKMGSCARWLRLFVNLALLAFETEKQKPAVPVLMCLDEFATLGHMRAIEDAAGQIAGFGVKLFFILQDLGQIEALYKQRWQTFMGNAGVLQFFGNNDLTTLEWAEKRLGKTSLQVLGTGDVADKARVETGVLGRSWSMQTQPLMTLEEISRFFGRDDPYRRALVINAGYPPIIVSRANYDSHAAFAGRFDPDDG